MSRKKRIIIPLLVVISVIISLIYGKYEISGATGDKNPDDVIEKNSSLKIQYRGDTSEYFNNDLSSLDELEECSDIIIKAEISDDRVMSLYSTKTSIAIKEIYKSDNDELSEGDVIYLIEPASINLEETYDTNGYKLVKTGDEYILFLKHLVCVDNYKYSPDEEISYMPVSELYSRFDVSNDEIAEVLTSDDVLYSEVSNYALFTTNKNDIDTYINLKKEIENKY